jgi:N-acetylneuraminic acid mutarotase
LAFSNGAGVINGKIYLSGGFANIQLDDLRIGLYMYDPAANTWTRKHDLPGILNADKDVEYSFGARGVTGVIGGKLYVFTACFVEFEPSGIAEEGCRERGPGFFRYNPVTDHWTILPSQIRRRARSRTRRVIGGSSPSGRIGEHAKAWFAVYDPSTTAGLEDLPDLNRPAQ